jgi:hypothetical protein
MPEYGAIPAELNESPDALIFSVGSFLTSGAELAFPAELRASETPVGPAYFIVQLKPSAIAPDQISRSLELITKTGATLIEYVPQNGYIVRTDPASYPALADLHSVLQYVRPYHPGYKIARDIGAAASRSAAASST